MRHQTNKEIEVEIIAVLTIQLENAGCDGSLIGSIFQAADNGDFARVGRAIEYAVYMNAEKGD